MLFVMGGRTPKLRSQPSLRWYFLLTSLFLLVSIGIGCLLFRRESHAAQDISISPKRR